MDSQKLIEEQTKRKELFTAITNSSDKRLTRTDIVARLKKVEKLFDEFKADHEKILEIGKPDIPYIVNNLGEKVMELMKGTIEELRQNPLLRTAPSDMNMTLGASEFQKFTDSEHDESKATDEHIASVIKKIEFKIKKLDFTISSISNELQSSVTWTKELVDLKNKFLFEQWNAISLLEEELAISLGEEIVSTAEIYEKMNKIFSEMIKKSQPSSSNVSKESGQPRLGKLPELKIPIFSGNFDHWLNFKDLYDNMIHKRKDIPVVEKMEYLKGCTDGQARELIEDYFLSADNYAAAYDTLVERYNNKRKLLTIYLEKMSKPIGKYATAESVKALHDGINKGMTTIKNMGIDNDSWGPIVVHLANLCLDSESRAMFESKFNESDTEIPELEDFLKFLKGRYKTLEILDPMRSTSNGSCKIKANQGVEKKADRDNKASKCPKCEGDHKLFMCPKFLSLSVKSRYRFVKALYICVNCLYKHKDKQCDSKKTCKHCDKAHNSLLHFPSEESNPKQKQANIGSDIKNPLIATEEVLATAQLQIRDVNGHPVIIRVLIDTGAQANFITEGLVQKLKLKRIPHTSEITGIGKIKAHKVKHAVEINLEPVFPSNFDVEVIALVLGKELTSTTPDQYIAERFSDSWPTLQLADPTFRQPGNIDMILGIGFFTRILMPEILRNETSKLIALKSKIGWLILGETERKNKRYASISSMICVKSDMDDISKFWEIEDIPAEKFMTSDDNQCEIFYKTSHKRLDDGRYMVMIPFKDSMKNESTLHESRKRALCRFYNLESKFKKDHAYAEGYRKFISEYLSMGHMEKARPDINVDSYYMPHHAVLKPDSTSTKLRVVFDASARTPKNVSLNQLMLAGPRLQDDLASILLRWRFHRFVFSADVEKMYRQIMIDPEHRRYQRIFWRNSPDEVLEEFELTTVTYGTTSAPYLAVKTLQQLAVDDHQKYPLAADIALRDFYVDDVLSGSDTIEECVILQNQLQQLLQGGGFTLRKWSSNKAEILQNIKPCDINQEALSLQELEESSIKTLGLIWRPKDDNFTFKSSRSEFPSLKKTKRNLCSDISRVFDPLGWLAPFTIGAKILFQATWKLSLGWDDILPENVIAEWAVYRDNLKNIEKINIPRWIETCKKSHVELHGFCDASMSAYAAVIYARITSESGVSSVKLLMSKTKVAPIKNELTIPRLELSAAHLLAKLYVYVIKSFGWEGKRFIAWSDSTIALSWIRGHPSKWNTFVANRVSQIQELTANCEWRYVSTTENPADCASRGITVTQLIEHHLWWSGPKWLEAEENSWPMKKVTLPENIPEMKKSHFSLKALTTEASPETIESIILRFSSYWRLKSCIAYCLRFINNCRSKTKTTGWLSTKELRTAEKVVIRQIQLIYFQEDIHNLENNKKINNKNGILSLTPKLDTDGLLRVTGRLQNAFMSYEEKHPIILPYRAYVSRLIVIEAHFKCHHGLNGLTEYVIRRRFWIVKCRNLVKNVIFRCVICRRRSPQMMTQLMGQLPESRVTLNNAFYFSGVDYAGPFVVKPWRGRCNKTYKSYICVFVCMTTKAIHLELASDLTADSFMAAYRRFSYRRGPCYHVYSDCGTNFVGANKIMTQDFGHFQNEWKSSIESMTPSGVTWHFNPPSNPHAGGLWEAAVKSVKHLLFKYLGNTLLTYEEFNTLLVQLEGCLNSRPLGIQRGVPEDQAVLTPSHFLIGTSLFSHPEPEQGTCSLATRWRYVQELRNQIFKEFKVQMLHQLQQRRKWNEVQPNIKEGDIVIVEDHNVPSHKYPIAIVNEVHPGQDGLTRVVTVKMESGRLLRRPISKMCPLPVVDDLHSASSPIELDSVDKNSKSSEQGESNSDPCNSMSGKQRRYNLRPRKMSKLGLTIGMLMTLFIGVFSTPVPTIERFEHNSGLVFAKVGEMKMSSSSWTMIMFYNMSSFFSELQNLQESTRLFYEKCDPQGPLRSYCTASYLDIQQQLNEIREDNQILMDMNHAIDHPLKNNRARRSATSLLPFVGTLSRAVFGTLDEDYARDVENTINSMQQDDMTMMNLIKNQTSVIETFLQQARISEERSTQQFGWISSNLEAMSNTINTLITENNLSIRLQFIASHIISRTQHLFSIQAAIIQAITNAHHGNLRSILHPSVFKKQLGIMKSSLPADLNTPVTSNNLLKLYDLLSVKTRVSESMVIFHFELPLVSSKQYEVYKTIPLPIRRVDSIVIVQPTTEYIAISLNQDKFIPISSSELTECEHLDEITFICHVHHPELKNHPYSDSCEMNLFMHHQFKPDLCHTVAMETSQFWIQLPIPRKWIFYTKETQLFTAVCDQKARQYLKLEGEGILNIPPSCTLEHKTFSIPSSTNFSTSVESTLYYPDVNLTEVEPNHFKLSTQNETTILIKRTDMYENIQNTLTSMKQHHVLRSHKITHNVSIWSISLSCLFVLFTLIYSVYLFHVRCKKLKPIPRPRTTTCAIIGGDNATELNMQPKLELQELSIPPYHELQKETTQQCTTCEQPPRRQDTTSSHYDLQQQTMQSFLQDITLS